MRIRPLATVAALAAEAAANAGVEPGDILDVTVVGNPVMHHLFLGLDPTELGTAPFALTLDGAYETPSSGLGLGLAPGCMIHALPCIAGHVGADAAAMILAERPDLDDDTRVLVDVGTNAEIVLADRTRLFAASSPTGPAFEGAQIACGQRAAPGAIERVRIDPATLEPRYRVIGCPLWSDEGGFEAAVAGTGVTGICGSGIIELVAELFLAGVVTPEGLIDGRLQGRTARVEAAGRTHRYVVRDGNAPVALYQTDVRAIQLAKAALYAGIKVLMRRAGVDTLDRITLAGAFGSHIDPRYALVLGMVPDCDPGRVASAGNAAGEGARIALLDRSSRDVVADLVGRVEKVETAVDPCFQEEFVAAMAFPHARDPFPHLGRVVTLPSRSAAGPLRHGRRAR